MNDPMAGRNRHRKPNRAYQLYSRVLYWIATR